MRKVCATNNRHILNHIKLFITLFIVLILGTGCSITRTKKESPSLAAVTANQVYQVRVRTGNLALDKIAYEYARDSFGKHLVVPSKGPYTGYIDIIFRSTTHAPLKWPSIINWSNPLKWSAPGYKRNVSYGDVWYTGKDKIGRKGIGRTETEVKPSGLLTWHNGVMSVTLKDTSMRKFWSTEYTYKGGWDPSEIVYTYSPDGAVKLSLDAVLKKFEGDYIIEPLKKKAAIELAARKAAEEEDAAQRAGIDYESKEIKEVKPVIALIKESNLPKKPEKPIQLDAKRWKFTGNNKAGIPVHIDKTNIYYPEKYVVQIWAATIRNNHKKTNRYEVACLNNKFRIIDKVPDNSSSTSKWSGQWTTIFPNSTPEVIFKAVCPENIRLQHAMKTKTTPSLSIAAAKVKIKSPEPGSVTPAIQMTNEIAKNTQTAETEETTDERKSAAGKKVILASQVTAGMGMLVKPEQTVQKLKTAPEEKEYPDTRDVAHESGAAVKVVYSPKTREDIHMDAERWKLLGRNQEEFTVYIDKKTISYPAPYVVKLWAATVRENQKQLNLYEIGCVESNFRTLDPASGKPVSASFWSNSWETIEPEGTPGLIYNNVCPKKRKPDNPVQVKNTPEPEKVDPDDAQRWKLLGENHKEFPVYIDKKTISYPAPYVVRLWSKIINDNHNHLELYEIGCLENNFRVVNEDSDKPAFLPSISKRWQIIFPESTPELIYNAVCPKKIRLRQKIARK